MLAFTIGDVATPDFSDKQGRALDEIFDIEVGIFENKLGSLSRLPLSYHSCTEEDFKRLYPMSADFKIAFDTLRSKWMCFDLDDLVFKGGKFDPYQKRPYVDVKIPARECRNDTYDS